MLNVAQFDGKQCATILVNKEADINTLGAARAVNRLMDDLRQQYPDITFSISRDTSKEIWLMFRVLGSSALFGAMLVLVILAWSMGLRISILVLKKQQQISRISFGNLDQQKVFIIVLLTEKKIP